MKHTTEELILAALVIERATKWRDTFTAKIPGTLTPEVIAEANAEATRQAIKELVGMADLIKSALEK